MTGKAGISGINVSNAIDKMRKVTKFRKASAVKRSTVDSGMIHCLRFMYDSKRVDWSLYINDSPEEFETKRRMLQDNLNELRECLSTMKLIDPDFDILKDRLNAYRTHIFKALEGKNEQELVRLTSFEENEDAMLFHHILSYLQELQ